MTRRPLAAPAVAFAILMIGSSATIIGQSGALPAVLTESIAAYAMLSSYSDTGRIRQEVPGIVDDSTFTTYFRRPTRDLFFEFQALTSTNPGNKFTIDMSAYRTVIWMFKGNMQTYDHKSRARVSVAGANGGQTLALQEFARATSGTSILIPSLLYSQAGLPGTIRQMQGVTVAGIEDVDNHRCQKVTGTAAVNLPSGRKANERQVTVWIDAQSHLIRRVLEETSATRTRLTITLDPRANPTLDDARFQFTPPA